MSGVGRIVLFVVAVGALGFVAFRSWNRPLNSGSPGVVTTPVDSLNYVRQEVKKNELQEQQALDKALEGAKEQ